MRDWYQTWRAGKTVRMHTAPQLHRENVGEHTFGILLALARYYPTASALLLRLVLVHDLGENKTGDIPGNVKWANPDLRNVVEGMEEAHVRDLGFDYPRPTQREALLLEAFDRLDFAVSCVHEMRLGNVNSAVYYRRSIEKAAEVINDLQRLFVPDEADQELKRMVEAAAAFYADVAKLRFTYLQHIPQSEFNER